MIKKLVLEYDDFHYLSPENCLSILDIMIAEFPDIKVSLFAPPALRYMPITYNPEWCSNVRKYIDSGNIVLARHGLTHDYLEFQKMSLDNSIEALKTGDEIFNKASLPYVKVFRGPYWGINKEAVEALNVNGYTHLYNHEDHRAYSKFFNGKTVYYNWNLKDEEPPDTDLIIAHGHTHNTCSNGILETFDRVRRYIENNNPEFLFVHEV